MSAALHQLDCRGTRAIVGHYDHADTRLAYLVIEVRLLVKTAIAGVQIEDENVNGTVPNELAEPVAA